MENQCQHLAEVQCNEFLNLLKIIEELFNGKLGIQKTDPADLKLK